VTAGGHVGGQVAPIRPVLLQAVTKTLLALLRPATRDETVQIL